MLPRSMLARGARCTNAALRRHARLASSARPPVGQQTPTEPVPGPSTAPQREKSWLTKKVEASPAFKTIFLQAANLLGYGSPKQVAGRRAFAMYEQLCIVRPDEDKAFWQEDCHLPPTFQSWFTIVNLHIWLLTVRLRALSPPHGMYHLQALIDHFFLDVEDRVRAILQPASPESVGTPSAAANPYTPPSDFYTIANPERKRPKGRAPERLVGQQMKIFKEQWAGMGMSFDISLLRGDPEMAAVVWRNLLGGRGARGIIYPADVQDPSKQYFRRSVNLVGGEVEKVKKVDERGLEVEEARDDGSGVHDYTPNEADKYVAYPELMATLVAYLRRELVRLQNIPDEAIIGPGVAGQESVGIQNLRFGRVRGDELF